MSARRQRNLAAKQPEASAARAIVGRCVAWLAAGWLLAGSASAASGDWFARSWRSEEGLPDNNVSDVVQTADGFLWVATSGGLMRFDGVRFEEFSPETIEGSPGRAVLNLTLDRSGRLWLGLDRGMVASLESGKARLFTEADGLPPLQTLAVVEDGAGGMLRCDSRANLSRIADGKVTVFGRETGLPSGTGLCSMVLDDANRLWVAKSSRVGIFRDGRFEVVTSFPDKEVVIGKASEGGVWVCAGGRLLHLDSDRRAQERGRLPEAVTPSVVFEDKSGAVWIGTMTSGLFRCADAEVEAVPTSHQEIRSLMQDTEGNLWVGTGGGGLNRLRRRVVELLSLEGALRGQSVRSVCTDASGRSWVAGWNGELLRGQEREWTVMAPTNWQGVRAMCVAADLSGAVWIGTDTGLWRWREGRFEHFGRDRGLEGGFVRSLLVSSRGDVWIALSGALQRLRGNEFKTFRLPPSVRTLRALAEDTAENVWLGTSDGRLFRFTDDTITDETERVQGEAQSIRCLRATADGSLWIGYAGKGLGRFKAGKFVRVLRHQGLADNYISQIAEDGSGRLWLAGNYGIFQLSLRELDDFAAGRVDHVRPNIFGRGEGVPNLQATCENAPGIWNDRKGHLWIATRTGLAVIRPENVPTNAEPPRVRLERVAVEGRTVALYDSRFPLGAAAAGETQELGGRGANLRLNPDPRRIEIEFTALSYTAPENVRFRYRLEEFDEDWSPETTERSARYPKLPAGNYRFHVIACNNAGVWNETGAMLNVTVAPFFWQTWWFRMAALGVFTIGVVAAVRYVSFRRLRTKLLLLEQQAALEKERTRIARDLHDDLGGSLTEAALLLDMAQNRGLAPEEITARTRHCSTLVRKVANSVDEIIWAINPRNDTLRYLIDYTSQFAVEFLHSAQLRCRVDLPDRLPERPVSPEVRHHLFLVVKEALNNIAQHAKASEVSLRIAAENGDVRIAIQDDGCGFAQAPDNARSDGLRNMRQRMEEIGGEFVLETKPGSGTRVEFVYPWPQAKN